MKVEEVHICVEGREVSEGWRSLCSKKRGKEMTNLLGLGSGSELGAAVQSECSSTALLCSGMSVSGSTLQWLWPENNHWIHISNSAHTVCSTLLQWVDSDYTQHYTLISLKCFVHLFERQAEAAAASCCNSNHVKKNVFFYLKKCLHSLFCFYPFVFGFEFELVFSSSIQMLHHPLHHCCYITDCVQYWGHPRYLHLKCYLNMF